jgi:hypothetical protein
VTRELLAYGTILLAWAAVAYKLPALARRPRDPGVRSFWLATLAIALALSARPAPVYLAISQLTGMPNAARLLDNALILVAAWCVQAFLFHLSHGQDRAGAGTRRAGWALAATLVAMAVLFALAPVDADEPAEFTARYGSAPFVLEYRLVFLAFLGYALQNVVRLSWRYAGLSQLPALRAGLRLVAAGGVTGLAWIAQGALLVTARRFGLEHPAVDAPGLSQALIAATIALTTLGSTLPSWGPRLGVGALAGWVSRYRAHRRLYPLWLALYRENPAIALYPPTSRLADALALRDLRFRLYRRVIEVRDGQLALRPFVDPDVVARARDLAAWAGLAGDDARAAVEAAGLASALGSRGRRVPTMPADAPASGAGGADLDGEARFLATVSRHLERSALVRAALSGGAGQPAREPAG